jgi:hypothetical protein
MTRKEKASIVLVPHVHQNQELKFVLLSIHCLEKVIMTTCCLLIFADYFGPFASWKRSYCFSLFYLKTELGLSLLCSVKTPLSFGLQKSLKLISKDSDLLVSEIKNSGIERL